MGHNQLWPAKAPVNTLSPSRFQVLDCALQNVLATDIAEETMAQLIDGLPLYRVGGNQGGQRIYRGHPLREHTELCPGVIEKTRLFRQNFAVSQVHVLARTLQSFEHANMGSKEFKLLLMELLALMVHEIAAILYQLQPKLHQGDIEAATTWMREPTWYERAGKRYYNEPPRPHATLFFHIYYLEFENYPNGLADVAGYWAEDRIFGGIVLFDRGQSGLESNDLYLHAGRIEETFRIWRPNEGQIDEMMAFLMADKPNTSPFPMFATMQNFHRYDPWDALARHHVYRNPWDRTIPDTRPPSPHCKSAHDYPQIQSMFNALQAAANGEPAADPILDENGEEEQDEEILGQIIWDFQKEGWHEDSDSDGLSTLSDTEPSVPQPAESNDESGEATNAKGHVD